MIYCTGVRVSDGVQRGEGNVDREGFLSVTQVKTGGKVDIPFKRDLPDFAEPFEGDLQNLQSAINARNDRHLTFLTTLNGASRSAKSVSQWLAAKARAAGIVGNTAHGLRTTPATCMAEDDASTQKIGAWTGHESLPEVQDYLKRFDRRKSLSKTTEEQKSSNSTNQVPTMLKK